MEKFTDSHLIFVYSTVYILYLNTFFKVGTLNNEKGN